MTQTLNNIIDQANTLVHSEEKYGLYYNVELAKEMIKLLNNYIDTIKATQFFKVHYTIKNSDAARMYLIIQADNINQATLLFNAKDEHNQAIIQKIEPVTFSL